MTLKLCIALSCAALIASCGGGSDAAPPPPVAKATVIGASGDGQAEPIKQEEKYMALDATGSFDPGGQPLTYTWALATRPAGSTRPLEQTAVPHIAQFDPDLPGDYVATLTVSNGAQSTQLAVPFHVVPDIAWFSTPEIGLHEPILTAYPNWAVKVGHAFSNFPFTVEAFLNGVSQGVRQEGELQEIGFPIRGSGSVKAYMFPLGSMPGGTYDVTVVMRAGGRLAEFHQQITVPGCGEPGALDPSRVRACP